MLDSLLSIQYFNETENFAACTTEILCNQDVMGVMQYFPLDLDGHMPTVTWIKQRLKLATMNQ